MLLMRSFFPCKSGPPWCFCPTPVSVGLRGLAWWWGGCGPCLVYVLLLAARSESLLGPASHFGQSSWRSHSPGPAPLATAVHDLSADGAHDKRYIPRECVRPRAWRGSTHAGRSPPSDRFDSITLPLMPLRLRPGRHRPGLGLAEFGRGHPLSPLTFPRRGNPNAARPARSTAMHSTQRGGAGAGLAPVLSFALACPGTPRLRALGAARCAPCSAASNVHLQVSRWMRTRPRILPGRRPRPRPPPAIIAPVSAVFRQRPRPPRSSHHPRGSRWRMRR